MIHGPGSVGISTERWRSIADLDSRSGAPVGNALREAADVIDEIKDLVHRTLTDELTDRQLALEGIDEILNGGK
jgi:hypothetical protein